MTLRQSPGTRDARVSRTAVQEMPTWRANLRDHATDLRDHDQATIGRFGAVV